MRWYNRNTWVPAEAAQNAMRFFADPFWRGPKPTPETIFEVVLVGDERKWRVRGRMALAAKFGPSDKLIV
jgi:hypothetical protein